MEYRDNWKETLSKYSTIKELYIKCEETDPELYTNLQPLNEFRAALDHIMKISMLLYKSSETKEDVEEIEEQFIKLNSHLDRAFYDICDMLSINYRNKIINALNKYDHDTISVVFPKYYSEWRANVEEISLRVARYRFEKGTTRENVVLAYKSYKDDVEYLQNVYLSIVKGMGSLEEIYAAKQETAATAEKKERNNKFIGILGIIVGILGILIGVLI
jgi:hypothetical protein